MSASEMPESALPDDADIREKAYALWEEAGSPAGRAEEFWDRARFLVGMGEAVAHGAGQEDNPLIADRKAGRTTPPPATPVEPAREALVNQGEFPGRFTDQGEVLPGPIADVPGQTTDLT